MDAKTIAETLEKKKRDEICLVALLDTLEYLKKGGRISKTVAFAAGLLNIKPVITVVDGEIQVIGKAEEVEAGQQPARAEFARAAASTSTSRSSSATAA